MGQIDAVDLVDRALRAMELCLSVQTDQLVPLPRRDSDGSVVHILRRGRLLTRRERRVWNSCMDLIDAVARRAGLSVCSDVSGDGEAGGSGPGGGIGAGGVSDVVIVEDEEETAQGV